MRSNTAWSILCLLPILSRLGDPELEEEGRKETFKMASCFLMVFRVDRKPQGKGLGGAYTWQTEPQAASHEWSLH